MLIAADETCVNVIRRSCRGAAAAALVAVALSGCGFSIHPGDQKPECTREEPEGSFSTIDPEGIACILESHEARFDLRNGTIDKTALGLPADEYAPDVQSRDGLISLEILGPEGVLEASTDRIRFFSTDDDADVSAITYFLTADTPEEFFTLLEDGSDAYGIDRDSVDRWIDSVTGETDAVSDFAFAPGTALGMNVSYDLRYDEAASVQVVIVEVYPL